MASSQIAPIWILGLAAACSTTSTPSPTVVPPEQVPKTVSLPEPKADTELKDAQTAKAAFELALRRDRAHQWLFALRAYEKALSYDENFDRARINLGLVAVRLKKLDQAERACSAVIKKNSNVSMAHYCMAEMYAAKSEWTEAATSYASALRLRKRAPIVRLAYARALISSKQTKQGMVQLTKTASEAGQKVGLVFRVGHEFEQLQNWKSAEVHYRQATKIDPSHYLSQFHLGRLLAHTNATTAAEEALIIPQKLKPKSIEPILELVAAAIEQDKPANALTYIKHSSQANIRRTEDHLDLARFYWFLGRPKEAREHVNKGLALPAKVAITQALEMIRKQIESKQRPQKVIRFRSPKRLSKSKPAQGRRTPSK